ncbi:MAG TPA: aspartate aminotransferase family protein [Thermoanaerobaculia bacterium]|nr:aspartate aminotransferase family protein [Thermoanaerobaculia bacterium]
MPGLERGDLPPRIVVPPPGPRSRALSAGLERFVAPGISTVAPGRPALVWQEACGANVLDADGNRFIDLTAGFGVAAVGHRHPEVLRAVAAQADLLVHALGDVAAHPGRLALAERLAALAPVDDAQVFFAVSGAEAVEIALKTALAATGRPGVVAFDPGYHGLTLGALAATARPAFRDPFAAHLHPHVARFPFGGDLSPVVARLERDDVASVLVEPIVGREGVLLPPPGWLARLSELCRRAGALLIADEIFTGFGRTGRMFAVEREGVRPDLLCCGKALGGGLPIAAVLGSRAVFRCWATPGEALHSATFVAHPLACAAALATLDLLEREGLPARAARLGDSIALRLARWPSLSPAITAVRGRGLLWGIELASADWAGRFARAALARGILLLAGGPAGRVAQIAPPLAIAEEQLEDALELLEGALGEIAEARP